MYTYHKRASIQRQSMARLKELAGQLVNKDRLPLGFQCLKSPFLRDQSKFFIFHRQTVELLGGPANQSRLL